MICVKELVKNFDDVCAVNNITLNIPEGEMLGLLGTNGAGKTTLLRMIASLQVVSYKSNPMSRRKYFLSKSIMSATL